MSFITDNKSTINIITPVALSAGIAYLVWKPKKDLKEGLIVGVVAFVVLYIITTQITKSLVNAATAPNNLTPSTTDSTGAADANFNADTWAQNLYNDINGTSNFLGLSDMFGVGHDESLYTQMNALSNNSLTAIYNSWNATYAAQYKNQSLVQAMKGSNYSETINALGFTTSLQVTVNAILARYATLGAV